MSWDAGTVVFIIDAHDREIMNAAPLQRCYGMLSMPFQKENNRLIFLKSTQKSVFINGFSIRGYESAKKC